MSRGDLRFGLQNVKSWNRYLILKNYLAKQCQIAQLAGLAQFPNDKQIKYQSVVIGYVLSSQKN